MIQIQESHMDAFTRQARGNFAQRMKEHILKYFPEQAAGLGADGVGRVIELGMQHAKDRGITAEGDVSRYIDVMVVLGENYDHEPWAKDIFDRQLGGSTRMNMVFAEARKKAGERTI
ncbi:MAG: hypothetical protein LAP61_12815 [Acidobacteriia bacterium]|nr:hypothetical protein [Terriglobia bacterium]